MNIKLLILLFNSHLLFVVADRDEQPYAHLKREQETGLQYLQVDLGYAIYEGTTNASTLLNTFKGIRFAEPPIGPLRWQAPRVPSLNRSYAIQASSFGSLCPQSQAAGPGVGPLPTGSEDCLFLNVYAPQNAIDLPVLVWIHGGGYGFGDGTQDLSFIINQNQNDFIGVSIQYRLGAFGFLAGDEVFRNGVVNAGLLDQHLALQWVQSYIELFGGDPTRVTISGSSAGGGSVMLHNIAYGGTLGESLFKNSITSSPFLPRQYGYSDWIPTQSYYAFASAAGCPPQQAYGSSSQSIFECLVSQDSETLKRASRDVSISGTYGSWAFLPVTDGSFLQSTPSQALLGRKINGMNHLSGNSAEDATFFVPQILTEDDLRAWIRQVLPLFEEDDIAGLLSQYPSSNDEIEPTSTRFATTGDEGRTALDVSALATGQQQRAFNIYAESTFVCPSYWLAEAYSSGDRKGYKYQYSVVPALHGFDVAAYLGPPQSYHGPEFVSSFQQIWGNFIRSSNPSIFDHGADYDRPNGSSLSELGEWPLFTAPDRGMINLNQSGGVIIETADLPQAPFNVSMYINPGLNNDFRIVDGYKWEGGRGNRCDYWRNIWSIVPH
ncbi:alpha/beta-hydrolase [Pyrenochaeta sp. DS3sAY3a]|nr:alpha/beta-hydrolase [Pyrenochaeta sp. DS3sAY3a]